MIAIAGIVAGLFAWFALSNPKQDIADVIWPKSPAPWEQVDAYYYPYRDQTQQSHSAFHFQSVKDCRDWIEGKALEYGDTNPGEGAWRCAIGEYDKMSEQQTYRLTLP